MIITNRVSHLSYYLGRRLIRVTHIGLPNLIAGRSIVPEYVQEDARPEILAAEAIGFLEHPRRLQEQRPVVEFLRSLDWPQWRTVRPSLETIARDRFQQPLWDMVAENFFAVMSVELQQGNPQRLLRERLLQP